MYGYVTEVRTSVNFKPLDCQIEKMLCELNDKFYYV